METYEYSGVYLDENSQPTQNRVTKSITAITREKADKIFNEDYADGIDLHTITCQGLVVWKKQEVK
tara:strand:- start:332 stop:529 length:198 start_codon:yes stop_codon:yes gene_type:complete